MSHSLAESNAFCRSFARRTAKNFYYSFLGLPADRFNAMCVLYSFMRVCDDLGDDEQYSVEERRGMLTDWEQLVQAFFTGDASVPPKHAPADESPPAICQGMRVLPALVVSADRFSIPRQYLLEVIRGVRSDLDAPRCTANGDSGSLSCRFQTFDELCEYCYQVAGVVGQCCIHIWGFRDPHALDLAVECGRAFQLTNILRDVAEDAASGRLYLPQEDFERFAYSPAELLRGNMDERYRAFMQFQVDRAQASYREAGPLLPLVSRTGRPVLKAMMNLYGGILSEIRRRDYDVFSRRVSVPGWRKWWIATQAVVEQKVFVRGRG